MLSSIDFMKYNIVMDVEKNSIWLLFETTLRFKPRLIEIGERYGATLQQVHVVTLFSDDKPHSMSWLANLLICDASNVTGIVDRLQAAGLVERKESEKDRRIKMIALTDKGRDLRKNLMLALAEEEKLITALTEKEKSELVRILTKFLQSFDNCPNQID